MKLIKNTQAFKIKSNDIAKVRILSIGVKNIIVELYGKEVTIKADNLQHTYIVNCKDLYSLGEYLKVRIHIL